MTTACKVNAISFLRMVIKNDCPFVKNMEVTPLPDGMAYLTFYMDVMGVDNTFKTKVPFDIGFTTHSVLTVVDKVKKEHLRIATDYMIDCPSDYQVATMYDRQWFSHQQNYEILTEYSFEGHGQHKVFDTWEALFFGIDRNPAILTKPKYAIIPRNTFATWSHQRYNPKQASFERVFGPYLVTAMKVDGLVHKNFCFMPDHGGYMPLIKLLRSRYVSYNSIKGKVTIFCGGK